MKPDLVKFAELIVDAVVEGNLVLDTDRIVEVAVACGVLVSDGRCFQRVPLREAEAGQTGQER